MIIGVFFLPHQIVRNDKISIRIVFVLRFPAQFAIENNIACIALGNLVGDNSRDNGVFALAAAFSSQAGNGQTALDQLRLGYLININFLIRLLSVKL